MSSALCATTPDSTTVKQKTVESWMTRENEQRTTPMHDEATYICNSCGEEIVVPVDLSAGERQEYVEDCPVCCRPNVIHVEIDEGGDVRVWAEGE